MQTGNTDFIYRKLDKACFQHDLAYGQSINFVKRIQSDPKYNGYQRGLASMVYKFFDKKSSGRDVANELNFQLVNKLHKQIIRKCTRREVHSSFRDNIWGVDLADTQSLRKYNKGIKYLLCPIDLFSKHAWVVPLKNKRGLVSLMHLKKYSQREENQIQYRLIMVVNFTINFLRGF